MAPLEGLKVIELARILAGPWVGQSLAELGADVTKIEAADGDDTRLWGPPFITRDGDKTAAYFYAANRGKTSVVIDLRCEKDQVRLREMIRDADVFVENFKFEGLSKYGLDYASLKELNPRLVYCSITGFGHTGPMARQPGYDFLLQGLSGLMSTTGEPDGSPQKVGVAVTDIVTGLYSTIGVLAALAQRDRTGKGQHIDMSLLDCATAMMANQNMNYLADGVSPTRQGNSHPNITPYDVYETRDSYLILAMGNDGQFRRACDVLGLADMASNPDFATNAARVHNRAAMNARLVVAIAQWDRDPLIQALTKANVPASPIQTVGENLESEQIKARGMVINPEGVPGVRGPWKFSDASLVLDRTAPTLPSGKS